MKTDNEEVIFNLHLFSKSLQIFCLKQDFEEDLLTFKFRKNLAVS